MVQEEVNNFELDNEAFNDYIYSSIDDYSKRIEVYYGGAGSGKSYGVMQKVVLKAMNEKRKVLVIRKIQRTIKDSIWSLTIHLLQEAGIYNYSKINRSDFEIKFLNGSVFLFKGLDDPEKIKSIAGITDVVIEEATELNYEDFTQLNLRLRPKEENPQIYIMFNPVSKSNWVYKYFFEDITVKEDERINIIKTTYSDNKFLPQEYIDELKKLEYRNPSYYRIYVLGEFATLDKLIYPVYEKRLISKEEVQGLERIQGLDFGYTNDPSAFVGGYYDKENKVIYVTDEYVKKGMLNDEIANTIIALGNQKDLTYADCAEQKSIAEIQRYNIRIEPTIKGPDSVIQGIQWINQHKLVVDERCYKTLEELENYTWVKDKKTGEYVNKPVDTYNHTLDALRYALTKQIKGTREVQIFDKRNFLRGIR